jgi:hypothetical protein
VSWRVVWVEIVNSPRAGKISARGPMVLEIKRKLDSLLSRGINSEPEAVYLMVEIRKLLEQQGEEDHYSFLSFHCNWALHSKLDREAAQRVLKLFDEADKHLKLVKEVRALPPLLRKEIYNISEMKHFEDELEEFLEANGLPSIDASRSDGWVYFLFLYASIISDCPLTIKASNVQSGIERVTVKVELANCVIEDDRHFKVRWEILDRNGQTGSLEVYNSFSLEPGFVQEGSEHESLRRTQD